MATLDFYLCDTPSSSADVGADSLDRIEDSRDLYDSIFSLR